MPEPNPKIQQILAAFDPYDSGYPRQAVDEAIALQAEITPHLIQIVEDVTVHPLDYLNRNSMAPTYAVMLLAHFREVRAHSALIKLFSLPQVALEPLFGDLITEDLSMILYRTCSGSLEQIKTLVLNQKAYEYCRSAASGAMVYAVLEGIADRAEVLAFFGSLFTGNEAEPDSVFWSSIAGDIYDLYPEELMEVIRQAYERELIDLMDIGLDSFEEALREGQEKTLAQTRAQMERRSFDDLHARMSWWAMFEAETEPIARKPAALPSAHKRQNQKKARRKMAKASQKKNRRRK
ncbi:MAG: DUF1186 domain-containing protein [Anaerolineae bacterium]